MSRDKAVEAAAEAMWRAEVSEIGAARRAREAEYWADQQEEAKAKWRRFAAAALSAASAAEGGEAVAWTTHNMLEDMKHPDTICGTIWPKEYGQANIPLYLSPSPQRELEELADKATALESSLETEGANINAYLRDDIESAISAMRRAALNPSAGEDDKL